MIARKGYCQNMYLCYNTQSIKKPVYNIPLGIILYLSRTRIKSCEDISRILKSNSKHLFLMHHHVTRLLAL